MFAVPFEARRTQNQSALGLTRAQLGQASRQRGTRLHLRERGNVNALDKGRIKREPHTIRLVEQHVLRTRKSIYNIQNERSVLCTQCASHVQRRKKLRQNVIRIT